MTHKEDNKDKANADRDALLAGHFFNEGVTKPVDPSATESARLNRWTQAMNVLDEADELAVESTLAWPQSVQPVANKPSATRWTSSPWFRTGLAAAIVLLISLFFIGTEIHAANGSLVIRLGPVGRPSNSEVVLPDAQWVSADDLDEAVQRRSRENLSALAIDLAEVFSTLERRRRADDAELIAAIMQLRQADLQRLDQIMQGFAMESAQQNAQTRATIAQLIDAGLLRLPPDQPNREDLY